MKVIHFYNSNGGGVQSVIKNLIKYSQGTNIENHVIIVVEFRQKSDFKIPFFEGSTSVKVFYYSRNWNFYYLSRKLKKLIPKPNSLLIAHDWLELGMISSLGLKNPVIQFLHSDSPYYYDLAKKFSDWIDCFICVSKLIKYNLSTLLPSRINDIQYFKMPVLNIDTFRSDGKDIRLLFVGRNDFAKGYHLLPQIDSLLLDRGIKVEWNVTGKGTNDNNCKEWFRRKTIKFHGEISQNHLVNLYINSDIILLPTFMEGTPLAIIEAMKCGVIPIVNNLPGGIDELVKDGFNGFKIQNNEPEDYVKKIQLLSENKNILQFLSKNASNLANSNYDAISNTFKIEKYFYLIHGTKKEKYPRKVLGSRLDQPYLPNFITTIIRSLK